MYTNDEMVHRYTRWITWVIELLCTLIVALVMINLGVTVLRALWDFYGLDRVISDQVPGLRQLVDWANGSFNRPRINELPMLLPALLWAFCGLLFALIMRNALPTVRTSSAGMLVEFTGGWLPVRWEGMRAIKVTSDVSGERYVLLLQTDTKQLTGWHRVYSFIYRLGHRHAFLVTSNISDFDKLVKTVLSESGRVARLSEGKDRQISLDESDQSPLFRFLLSPAGFFSGRTSLDDAGTQDSNATIPLPSDMSGSIRATYPARISAFFTWGSIGLVLLALVHYFNNWVRFLALEVPALRQVPPFSWTQSDSRYVELFNAYATRPVPFLGLPGNDVLPAPWWLLVSAHLLLILAFGLALMLRNLLPALETRPDGLAVRNNYNGRWQLINWSRVLTIKATDLSEDTQIVLLQTRGGKLPPGRRLSSVLYDGSTAPGILITSALSNFQPLLQQVITEVTRVQGDRAENEAPLLQQEAQSWLLGLTLQPRATLEQLVAAGRDDPDTSTLTPANLLRPVRPMLWVTLPIALMLVISAGLLPDVAPGIGLLFQALILFFFALIEWPLVSLLSVVLDENTGGGEEGYRAVYLYPVAQLPRLLALLLSLALMISGLPGLWIIAWLGAVVWSYFLSSGLWQTLYNWEGNQSLLGGLIPVIWQLLIMLFFLLVQA
jgi:hypothetical protein